MRRLLGLALLALVLLPDPVRAGTERDPEVSDPKDQRDPSLDLLATWFEAEEDGLRFTLKVAGLREPRPNQLYYVALRAEGSASADYAFAAVGFDARGRFVSYVGPPNGARWETRDFGSVANDRVLDASFREGEPAYLSGVLPWGVAKGLEPDARLRVTDTGTTAFRNNRWDGGVDSASSGFFTVSSGGPFGLSGGSSNLVVPLACAALGGVLGYLLSLRPKR